MTDSKEIAKQLQGESIAQINNVSHLLRDAITAAIPGNFSQAGVLITS